MTARTCPKCGGPLLDAPGWLASPCPSCDAVPAKVLAAARAPDLAPAADGPPAAPAPRGPISGRALAALAFGFVAIAAAALFVGSQPRDPARSTAPDPSAFDLEIACRVAVKARLHDPGSVEWVDRRVVQVEDGWGVTLQVRARNAFNALRLTTFVCLHSADGRVLTVAEDRPR